MDVERHTKRQVRYLIYNYKSQLYKAFVISDVCNRSLCVIPFKTEVHGQKPRTSIKAVNVNRYRSVDITGLKFKKTCINSPAANLFNRVLIYGNKTDWSRIWFVIIQLLEQNLVAQRESDMFVHHEQSHRQN